MFDHYWAWILKNKEWLFSGAGVAAISVLYKFLLRRREKSGVSQEIRSGSSSQNLQAGRDIHLTVRDDHAQKQSPSQRFVDDLVVFCSESKAATTKLFLARPTQANPGNQQAYVAAFSECEVHDASGQRLQLRARDAFSETDVQRELFEFLRRTSLARQALLITEEAYRDRAFAEDQTWVDAQSRRVISAAARAAGYDLERGEVPFMIGFRPSFAGEFPFDETDGQPPSSRIIYEHSLERVKEQTEAAGHRWDPSTWAQRSPKRKERPEPRAIPRRDSEPDIRKEKVVSAFPFEEKHLLWLAGYDSRPALVLRDHCFCQLTVRVTTRNTQLLKSFEEFKEGRQPIDLISPRVSKKACDLLRTKSSETLQKDREKLQEELRESLEEDFNQYGYELVELSIDFRLAH